MVLQWPGVKVATGLESTYTEKLEIGYRWYDSHNVAPKYSFGHVRPPSFPPFQTPPCAALHPLIGKIWPALHSGMREHASSSRGFGISCCLCLRVRCLSLPLLVVAQGLSYANFSYSNLKVTGTTITATVTNTGAVAGSEIAQLYLGFPKTAGEPPQQVSSETAISCPGHQLRLTSPAHCCSVFVEQPLKCCPTLSFWTTQLRGFEKIELAAGAPPARHCALPHCAARGLESTHSLKTCAGSLTKI